MFKFTGIFVYFILMEITFALPLKDQEIDNLIYKLQGLKQKNHVMGSFKSGNDRGGHLIEKTEDCNDRKNSNNIEKQNQNLAPQLQLRQRSHPLVVLSTNADEHHRGGASGLPSLMMPANNFFEKRKIARSNFDEIDNTPLVGFNMKRNFDEIDRSALSGYFNKRNFDEIDRSALSGNFNKRNFDEIDRSALSGNFNKRNFDEIDRSALSGYFNKRNFDEIDRSPLSEGGFYKRNFDEIDSSPLNNGYFSINHLNG